MRARKVKRALMIFAVVFVTATVAHVINRGPDWLGAAIGVPAALAIVMALDALRDRRVNERRAR